MAGFGLFSYGASSELFKSVMLMYGIILGFLGFGLQRTSAGSTLPRGSPLRRSQTEDS